MNLRESIRRTLREESKTPLFLRRRFTQEELDQLMNDINTSVDSGKDLEDTIYDEMRQLITGKSGSLGLEDIDDDIYWKLYVKYEMVLGRYVRERLLSND